MHTRGLSPQRPAYVFVGIDSQMFIVYVFCHQSNEVHPVPGSSTRWSSHVLDRKKLMLLLTLFITLLLICFAAHRQLWWSGWRLWVPVGAGGALPIPWGQALVSKLAATGESSLLLTAWENRLVLACGSSRWLWCLSLWLW